MYIKSIRVGRAFGLFYFGGQWCHRDSLAFDFSYLISIITASYKDYLSYSNKMASEI